MTVKTDRLITLIGGGGFVGRYVAQALFKAGARVRIAEREPRRAFSLKPLCGLGQIQFLRADIAGGRGIAAAVEGADAVVNLVGILKGEGERAVRAAFPAATIVRPSIAFGQEDDFVNKFARMAQRLPVLPVLRGAWKLQPVHVADLGKAIALAALDPLPHAGKTYELGGPQVMTMAELNRWICEATGRARTVIEIPDPIGKAMARATGWLPMAPITWDQWLMLEKDNVATGPGFEAFGLSPAPLAAVAQAWLASYRRHGRFARAAAR